MDPNNNIIDQVWGSAKPNSPDGPVRVHKIEFAGVSIADKLGIIRNKMAEYKSHSLVLTSLDEICYLFNLRGCDVPCNPVAISYAIITIGTLILYFTNIKNIIIR